MALLWLVLCVYLLCYGAIMVCALCVCVLNHGAIMVCALCVYLLCYGASMVCALCMCALYYGVCLFLVCFFSTWQAPPVYEGRTFLFHVTHSYVT